MVETARRDNTDAALFLRMGNAMPYPVKIPDTPEFRAMWEGPMLVREIARFYGVTRPAISLAAKRFGYPLRFDRVGRS